MEIIWTLYVNFFIVKVLFVGLFLSFLDIIGLKLLLLLSMSQKGHQDNLLIDFDNLSVDESKECNKQNSNELFARSSSSNDLISIRSRESEISDKSAAFICSSVPIYKLLNSNASDDTESNNPFDQMDKQAALLDDPFEILSNTASNSSYSLNNVNKNNVQTGTLISFDSPSHVKIDFNESPNLNPPNTQKQNNNESAPNTSQISLENIKNTPRRPSPCGKNRVKTKNNSLNLLKYSLSNSRSEVFNENESPVFSDDSASADEILHRKTLKVSSRKNSTTDDSFDDIWSTKPNLIDSQTDIDIESDFDNDIAELNIPMLNTVTTITRQENKSDSKTTDASPEENLPEVKYTNRSELLEKLASIKQKIPQSPMSNATFINQLTHNQTVDMKINSHYEPMTPKSQYSSIFPQHLITQPNNPNSLIENLKKLVDQCDDKIKQVAAKNLLDSLSSILASNQSPKNSECEEKSNNIAEDCKPKPIKREGTFSIDKTEDKESDPLSAQVENSTNKVTLETDINSMNPSLSNVVKQIQNVLGTHQNINVLQTNMEQMTQPAAEFSSVNPTYIVVMAQPAINYNDDLEEEIETNQQPNRSRSKSLNLREKPLAALRATQNKIDHQQIQTTPVRRPALIRRSSFGAMTRPIFNKPSNCKDETAAKISQDQKNTVMPKLKRRTSIHLPSDVQPVPQKDTNLTRRRSFQEPRIRSPSPKKNIQTRLTSGNRMSGGASLSRRKSIHNEATSKDSPQKPKSLYGIMKKPPAPPATRSLKIRVTQTMGTGRSTAPLRAIVPISRVAPLLMSGETVSPIDDSKTKSIITSTPRSMLSSASAILKLKKSMIYFCFRTDIPLNFLYNLDDSSTAGSLPAESPIHKAHKESSYLSTSRVMNAGIVQKPIIHRRRTLSDYRINAKTSAAPETIESSTGSNLKRATTALASGLNKFTTKRLVSIFFTWYLELPVN